MFFLISEDNTRVLECQSVESDHYDYQINLHVLQDDGEIHSSQWKCLDKDSVSVLLEDNWDLSQTNPLL
jgi:hypothetical protein